MRGVALALVALTAGCAPTVLWYGSSPDRRRRVEVVAIGKEQYVRVGTSASLWQEFKEGPRFEAIGVDALVMSPNSRKLAYPAYVMGKWLVMVDADALAPSWDGIGTIVFSPDSEHLAFAAADGDLWRVVADGRRGPPWSSILAGSLRFSPRGGRLAYAATRAGRAYVVIDGTVSPAWDGVGGLVFSADGKRLAYCGRRGRQVRLVVDGVEGPPYDRISEMAMTRDGAHVAYVAERGGRFHVVVDGTEGRAYQAVRDLHLADAGTAVYIARSGTGTFVVRGAIEGDPYDDVTQLVLDGSGQSLFVAQRGSRSTLIIGDAPASGAARASGPNAAPASAPGLAEAVAPASAPRAAADAEQWFDRIENLVVAGAHHGFVGWRRGKPVVVIDGQPAPGQSDWAGDLVLSADGRRYAYLTQSGQRKLIVSSARGSFAVDAFLPGSLVVSRDGAHFACVVGLKQGRRIVILVDGQHAGPFDVQELTAALGRPWAGPMAGEPSNLIRRWVAAELALWLTRPPGQQRDRAATSPQ